MADEIAVGVERKFTQQRLHERQEWLRVTLASIGDAVIATDTRGGSLPQRRGPSVDRLDTGRGPGATTRSRFPILNETDPSAGGKPGREGTAGRRRCGAGEP